MTLSILQDELDRVQWRKNCAHVTWDSPE